MSRGKPQPKQLENGLWQGRITWTDPSTGKRLELTETFTDHSEAVEWTDMVYRRRKQGTLHAYYLERRKEKYTVKAMLDDYFASRAFLTLSAGSRRNYQSYAKRVVIPEFGHLPAESVSVGAVKRWVKAQFDEKKSASAVRQATSPLSMAYEEAIEDGRLNHNPVKPVEIQPRKHKRKHGDADEEKVSSKRAPKKVANTGTPFVGPAELDVDDEEYDMEPRAFSESELPLLYKAFNTSRERVLLNVLLGMGLRPSESVALFWGDINLKKKKLRVARSSDEDGNLGPCKSESAYRTLAIPEYLVKMLKSHRPKGANRDELVFPSRWGNVKKVSSVRDAFKLALRKVGLDESHRLYDLRHTHASLIWQETKDPKAVSERLGHSSVAFTLYQYVWMNEADDNACADAMDKYAGAAGMKG